MKKFAMYLGTIKRVGTSKAEHLFLEVQHRGGGAGLFFFLCKKEKKEDNENNVPTLQKQI